MGKDKTKSNQIIEIVKDITLQNEVICKKLIDSAVASKQTTDDPDDLKSWAENDLEPNTVIIGDPEQYEKIFIAALRTLDNQVLVGVNGETRDKIAGLNNKITGYLAEEGVVMLAKQKHNIDLQLAHGKGKIEEFQDKDISKILDNNVWRNPYKNVGVKSAPHNAIWLDIPCNQFVNTDIQILAKILCDKDHFTRFLTWYNQEKYIKNVEKGNWTLEECNEYIKNNLFNPIAIYLVGWASKDDEYSELDYKGVKKRTIFHIQEYKGRLSKDYKTKIRKENNLHDNFKIEFSGIKEFSRLKKTDLFVFNNKNVMKTQLEWKDLFKTL